MEEPYKKRNILLVFFVLLIIFVFLYKGIILSGDEYILEYLKYSNDQLPKTTSLKITKIGVLETKKEKKKEEKAKAVNTTNILRVIESLYFIHYLIINLLERKSTIK